MRKIFLIGWFFVLLLTLGCASSGPLSERETFPLRNQDPTLGLIINEGTAHLNIYIYDEAGRLIEQVYLAGANHYLTINDRHIPRYWVRQLEVGRYKVEVYPFYYQNQLIPPARYRVDLQKQVYGIYVDRNPTDQYDQLTGRHWAWILRLGERIPETADNGFLGIRLNIRRY